MLSFSEFEAKNIKEETTTCDARGLGFATGNPAVSPEGVQNYVAQNTSDSDNKNNILQAIKDNSTKHNLVKFKAFNPLDRIGSKKKSL